MAIGLGTMWTVPKVTSFAWEHQGGGSPLPHQYKCSANGCISQCFNASTILAGRCIWFSAVLKLTKSPTSDVVIVFDHSVITFTAKVKIGGHYQTKTFTIPVPSAIITFSHTNPPASTHFTSGAFHTTVPLHPSGNVLLTGAMFCVPYDLPGSINPVQWSGTFHTDTPNLALQWQWGAAVYKSCTCPPNLAALLVKPADGGDHAGTPEAIKTSVVAGGTGGGGSNYTGSLSSAESPCFTCRKY